MPPVKLILPLPPKGFGPNAPDKAELKAQEVKAYQKLAWIAAMATFDGVPPPGWLEAVVSVNAYYPTYRFPNHSTLLTQLKPAFVAIKECGVVASHTALEVQKPAFMKDRNYPRVELLIRDASR